MPLTAFMVEDDPVIRETLSIMLLEFLGAHVVGTAETAEDALAWIAASDRHWDLTVLDLFLREGTGFTVLGHMTPAHRRQCVVLTNSATPANIARCIDLGADAVFDKSLQLDEFLKYCGLLLPVAQDRL
jgi:DNA-binding NarL/FixJ family response regulator